MTKELMDAVVKDEGIECAKRSIKINILSMGTVGGVAAGADTGGAGIEAGGAGTEYMAEGGIEGTFVAEGGVQDVCCVK
jgi:hypothetical protein